MKVDILCPLTGVKHHYYMDGKLYREINQKIRPALRGKDEDWVVVIDGPERGGKSTFAIQVCKVVDPSFCQARVCYTPDDFKRAIMEAKKGQAVLFDEAYRGLGSRGALTEVNKVLTSLMMEMGQKNLFVVIVLPTFFLLERYVAIWRARGLFHVYRYKNKRGFWRYYNQKKKKKLYLFGKKDYSYSCVKTGFKGRFLNYYPIDEAEYRKHKALSFKEGFKSTKDQNYLAQRNTLIHMINYEMGYNQQDISRLCEKFKIKLKRVAIGNILKKFKKGAA